MGASADDPRAVAPVHPVPPGSVLLHLGPHKTGSTAVQQAVHAARDLLAEHGVHYAGSAARPRRAVWSLGVRGRPVGVEQPPERHWRALVDEVGEAARAGRRVLLSNEDLGRATDEQLARVVDDLTAVLPEGGAVHAVAAARRYDRYLPSQWQERVKGGEPRAFADWLADVLAPDDQEPRWAEGETGFSYERTNVWFAHDTAALLRRWTDRVAPERLTVAVGDGSDRRALPDLVAGLVGVPAGVVPLADDRSNRSLSWAEAELVRSFSALLADDGWSRAEIRPWSGRTLVPALADASAGALPEPEGRRTPPLPPWVVEPLHARSEARVRDLRSLAGTGVTAVGDLGALLLPPTSDLDLDDPDHPAVPPTVTTPAAAAALAAFARRPAAG